MVGKGARKHNGHALATACGAGGTRNAAAFRQRGLPLYSAIYYEPVARPARGTQMTRRQDAMLTETAPQAHPPHAQDMQGVRHFSDSIAVTGVLPGSRSFGRDELLALADVRSGPATIACYSGRHVRDLGGMRGVRLTALLDAAGMQSLPRAVCKRLVIAALAGDGYACLFTWHELYNTPVGEGAIVMVEQDGVALPPSAGGLQLVSLGDLRLGPRQASAVNRIEVRGWQAAG